MLLGKKKRALPWSRLIVSAGCNRFMPIPAGTTKRIRAELVASFETRAYRSPQPCRRSQKKRSNVLHERVPSAGTTTVCCRKNDRPRSRFDRRSQTNNNNHGSAGVRQRFDYAIIASDGFSTGIECKINLRRDSTYFYRLRK